MSEFVDFGRKMTIQFQISYFPENGEVFHRLVLPDRYRPLRYSISLMPTVCSSASRGTIKWSMIQSSRIFVISDISPGIVPDFGPSPAYDMTLSAKTAGTCSF